jgi:hypothetical protein
LRLVTLNHFTNQFYDLMEIFRIGGHALYTNYLFLGALANCDQMTEDQIIKIEYYATAHTQVERLDATTPNSRPV